MSPAADPAYPEFGIGPACREPGGCGIVSAFTATPVRVDVAMTGEITLRGKVLPVGGIKEKILAARRAGLTSVVCPASNAQELEEVPNHLPVHLDGDGLAVLDERQRAGLQGLLEVGDRFFIQNTNNWPYSAAGPDSPDPDDYERYFQRGGEKDATLVPFPELTDREREVLTLRTQRRLSFGEIARRIGVSSANVANDEVTGTIGDASVISLASKSLLPRSSSRTASQL